MNIFWKNTVTSGSFTSAANWVQGVVPGANDVAELTTSGAKVIDNFGTTTTVLGLNLVSTGILAVKGNLTATEGTAAGANRGTIDINGFLTRGRHLRQHRDDQRLDRRFSEFPIFRRHAQGQRHRVS